MLRTLVLPALLAFLLSGCTRTITNPAVMLSRQDVSDSTHARALDMLMTRPGTLDAESIDVLQGMVYRPGYDEALRIRGMTFLLEVDRGTLLRTLRQRLPRITDHDWLRRCCAFVANHDLVELDEALVSSWGRPWTGNLPDDQRPEFLALERMHGPGGAVDAAWATFITATRPSQRGLRYRCWDLLHRLGGRDRLIAMIRQADDSTTHPLLIDLKAGVEAFGTVPWNREEILWMSKLREPSRRAFWRDLEAALDSVPPARRSDLELRDLPVVLAASRHHMDLITQDDEALYDAIARHTSGQRHYSEIDPGFLPGDDVSERLADHRDAHTWGDLAAMSIAIEAMRVPQVRSHIFHYADRDFEDESTEYGGIIQLDEAGRFEVLEFLPRVRVHDRRFEASQAMFDAGYTAVFHFHLHAQKRRNGSHAGPGAGDLAYADATRANCLVFTTIDEHTMNVDYYRHGRVIADLGVIKRPGFETADGSW